jgi:hypothetical protein
VLPPATKSTPIVPASLSPPFFAHGFDHTGIPVELVLLRAVLLVEREEEREAADAHCESNGQQGGAESAITPDP